MKIQKIKLLLLLSTITFLGAAMSRASGDGWLTDYETALSKAKEENKIVLIDFQGSDWCPPCIKLNNEVLSTDAFKALAEKSLVLVVADFPKKTKLPEAQVEHNNALAKKFGIQFFPTVLLVDQNGEVLDKLVGYPKDGVEGFLEFVQSKTVSGS